MRFFGHMLLFIGHIQVGLVTMHDVEVFLSLFHFKIVFLCVFM